MFATVHFKGDALPLRLPNLKMRCSQDTIAQDYLEVSFRMFLINFAIPSTSTEGGCCRRCTPLWAWGHVMQVDYCLVHLEQLSSERTEQQRPPLSPVDWEACLMFPSVTAT